MRLIFEQIRAGGDRNFGYVLGDREAKVGVLIDPSYSPETFVDRATAQGIRISHVINTHSHPDHTNGNAKAIDLTGAPLAAHPGSPTMPEVPLVDGQELAVGGVTLRCFHAPGHCPDHLVLHEPFHHLLITGDMLFVGKVGGTSTEDDAKIQWEGLQRLLHNIPNHTTVWPGHDYGARPSSTMQLERETNPFLLCPDLAAFMKLKAEWPQVKARLGLR